ncbi:TetR/AcrR family transcriptional regulator [Marinivivus vitaminiproducens]|uniref:TetR/AcrR family transcriptional regulator n=1 Tax=Marinivivus vitaminiproducens TaxID=3035935 RepID=UPI0027A6859E|nr:TetR family transcriptional regulator [Geminicoccaceae bacterium SCSIO 64248]
MSDHGSAASSGKRALRSDAQRNRDRLVESAAALFSAEGVDTSLEAIARRAGVGIGTLYRHFPTREALIEVVYRREVEALRDAADELTRMQEPDEALAQWMQRFVDYIAAKRGMGESLKILFESKSPLFAETSGIIPTTLKTLVSRAVEAGKIRADADSVDVLHALSSIYAAAAGPDWRERSRRLVRLLMDGLRYGAER